jgi:hypothetical protein
MKQLKNLPTECQQKYVGHTFMFQPHRSALYFTDPLATHTTNTIWTNVHTTPELFADTSRYISKYVHSSHASNFSSHRPFKWFRRSTRLREGSNKPFKRPYRTSSFPQRRSECVHRSGHVGFLVDKVLRFPLPIRIPPFIPKSSSIIWCCCDRPNSGRTTKWTQSHHKREGNGKW